LFAPGFADFGFGLDFLGEYADMVAGWDDLYHITMDIIKAVKDMVAEREQADQEELIRKLEGFLTVEVFPYGQKIMNASYYSEDVAPARAVVIQQPSPVGRGTQVVLAGSEKGIEIKEEG